jgi:hypothetical protein
MYIGKYLLPGGILANVIWGENMKRGREKGRKGKEKEKEKVKG